MTNHSHGTYGWHDHPMFDSTGDHVASHDAAEQVKLEKFFSGATWIDGIGLNWPSTQATGWADIASWQTEGRYNSRKA